MMRPVLRSITSIALTVWLTMLACIAGCGQVFAQSHANSDFASSKQVSGEMPACHPSHSSTPSPQKKQEPASISCCLPDAISQKSTPASVEVFATEAPIPSIGFALPDMARPVTPFLRDVRSHRGRDTLLEIHLLRI